MRVFRERVFRVEHPDGGAFFLLPAKGDEMKELDELVSMEYVVHDGQLVFNAKTGMPVARPRQNIEAVIQRAIRKVKAFEGIQEESPEGSGNFIPMASTPENIEFLVRNYIGTKSIDVEVPELTETGEQLLDEHGKKRTTREPRAVPEPLYLWIAEQVKSVTEQLREEQRKNS